MGKKNEIFKNWSLLIYFSGFNSMQKGQQRVSYRGTGYRE